MATQNTTSRKSAKITAKKPAKKAAKPKPSAKAAPDAPKVYFAPPTPTASDAPTFPVVNAKCRRGADKQTEGQACQSITAENMSPPGASVVQFRCTKCKHVWRVPMGGSFQGA